MKILYTNFHAGDGGGHTTYITVLARGLAAHHTLHVAAPAGSRVLRMVGEEGTAQTIEIGFRSGLRDLSSQREDLRRLRDHVREQQFDVIHANGARDHRMVIRACAGLSPRPAIIFTKHNSKSSNSLGNWLRARRGTDRVIAVSAHTHDLLLRSPYRRVPIDVVRNGIDLQHYAPATAQDAASMRAAWTHDPDALILASSAGTDPHKGWIDLVRAVARMPPDIAAHVHIVVAGKPIGTALLEEVRTLGMADRFHYAGLVDDVRPVIAGADAGFVLSWDIETISFACREMMAMGKPVMASNYAGLPENIHVGQDGWVVPARDVEAIARQVERLYQQRGQLSAMGRAARAHAEDAFGQELFCAETLRTYAQAIAGARR